MKTINVAAFDPVKYPDIVLLRYNGDSLMLLAALTEILENVDASGLIYGGASYSESDLLSFLKADGYETDHVFAFALDRTKVESFDPEGEAFKAHIMTYHNEDERHLPERDTDAFAFNRNVSSELVEAFLAEEGDDNHFFLLRHVQTDKGFIELKKVYESLYEKHHRRRLITNYGSFVIAEGDQGISFPDDEYLSQLLTDEELSLYKFTLMTELHETLTRYADSWRRESAFIQITKDLPAGAFERFGITDHDIDKIWKAKKMHKGYFIARIMQEKKPNPYHCDGEYVTTETEVKLWRGWPEYMKEALDWTREMCEPEDRG
ncbi:hypothetical protein [Sulfurovum mangrovi]|uniref:hypothetical protein n=1 Tax=Sulfurovum mangrovi TaxID=2893889 RepID=UPI001E28DD54|nr:hypothetical protein [Sulfurovum mangrovi]UFH59856.1 hypothetical protein LN246_03185 [Sulfurovum mangrovi]UFH59907.1 hypothetical protein LN246_03445 [Sulfurovum mangrovi]